MGGVFHALNPESYELGLGKVLPATAGKRFMNWAEFIGTESHGRSPALWGTCEGRNIRGNFTGRTSADYSSTH